MAYISEFTTKDFSHGDKVLYVPGHANGDTLHKDCEEGTVSSCNEMNVFVRYRKNGITQETSQATNPRDLIKIRSNPDPRA